MQRFDVFIRHRVSQSCLRPARRKTLRATFHIRVQTTGRITPQGWSTTIGNCLEALVRWSGLARPSGACLAVACVLAAGLGVQSALAAPQAAPGNQAGVSDRAMAAYGRVAGRVKASADTLCRERPPSGGAETCNFSFAISDDRSAPPNAFQSRSAGGRPTITLTVRLLERLEDDHQIALVLSHEAAHHLAGHIDRMNGRASSDAFLPGPGRSRGKGFELEADWVGSFISEAAGYDPQVGARVFSRSGAGDVRKSSGSSSHPSSSERLKVIAAASAEIARQRASGRTPRLE